MGNKRDIYGDLVGTSEGNRPLGILRRGLENTVKMGLQDASWGGMDRIDVLRIGTVGEAWTGLMCSE
jgi:hypothetical protein